MGNVVRLGCILSIICMVSGWSLSAVNNMTRDKIAEYGRIQEEKARRAVLLPRSLNLLDFPQGLYSWEDPHSGERILVPLSELSTIDDPIEYTPAPDSGVTEETLNQVQRNINEYQEVNLVQASGPHLQVLEAVRNAFLDGFQFKQRMFVPLEIMDDNQVVAIKIEVAEDEGLLRGSLEGVDISFEGDANMVTPYRIGERAWAGLSEGDSVSLSGRRSIAKNLIKPVRPFVFHEGVIGTRAFGAVFRIEAPGYGGPIEAIVGVDRSGNVSGVRILGHSETPGLGARITEVNPTVTERLKGRLGRDDLDPELPWFIAQFGGLDIQELYLISDDANGKIDGITAATITARALTEGIRKGMEKYRAVIDSMEGR